MKTMTDAQKAARDERRGKFRELWRQVAKMSDDQRRAFLDGHGIIYTTCEGHELSLCNCMLVALQLPGASVLGGFRQWLKHGRAVVKGQHGAMIWVPTGGRKNDVPLDGTDGGVSAVADGNPGGEPERQGFVIGTVFDIGQTYEIEIEPIAPETRESEAA